MKWDGSMKQEGGEERKRVMRKRKENREGERISCALNLQCCSLPLDGGTVRYNQFMYVTRNYSIV